MGGFIAAVLGATGGPRESNLTSYLVSRKDRLDFIALDAGTLLTGIDVLLQKNEARFSQLNLESDIQFLQKHIHGYFISHSHLDHLTGLILCSQVDSKKPIFAFKDTLEAISQHLFNNRIWPNYGNMGEKPVINHYHYTPIEIGQESYVAAAGLYVEPFPLAHHKDVISTAFLVRNDRDYLLYFGDTASDKISKKNYMRVVWERVAPLVREKRLKAIFLECSYSEKDEEAYRDSHLTPIIMMDELSVLAELAQEDLSSVSLVVIHRKESSKRGKKMFGEIEEELKKDNRVKIKLIFPSQGDLLEF